MSAQRKPNLPPHLNLIKKITEQYSQMIQSFDSKLTNLENAAKNCEYILNEQKANHTQLLKRVELLENSNSNNNHNKKSVSVALVATIEETQYSDDNKSESDSSLTELEATILGENMNITNQKLKPPKTKPKSKVQNIDYAVLFSSFESNITLSQHSMQINDFETALQYLKDGLSELNTYINCDNISQIPSNKKHIISVAYCNKAICCGKLRQFNEAMSAIHKSILLRPKWYKPYSTMAALYVCQKMDNKAITAYKKALDLCNECNGNGIDIETKNKIERRYRQAMQKMQSNNDLQNRKRKKRISLNESPAKKRVKYSTNMDMPQRIKLIKQKLVLKTVSELGKMCDMNGQKKTGRKDELIERVTDGILNGAIVQGCPKCGNKFLKRDLKNEGYYTCKGKYDVQTKKRIPCDFHSNTVQRKAWV